MPKIETTEWVFLVNARIEVNGKPLPVTKWSSNENYDDCYRKMDNYIRKNSQPEDLITKHILSFSAKEYPINYD